MKRDPNKSTLRHILIRMIETINKYIILKAEKSKNKITYKGKFLRVIADF